MSSCSSSSSNSSFEIEELLQIGTRCEELRKEKEMLKDSQSHSFELIRRLEFHVKTLSKARAEDEKRIQELERELRNSSQEIDYLQEQLNARNEELYSMGEHVHSLELKLADMGSLEEKVHRLSEELQWSNSEHLILMQESISSVALEYQCEIESLKLDLATLEQSCFEANKFKNEAAQEKARTNELIQDFELQLGEAQQVIECLNKENEELREKLETYEMNARVFCQTIEEQFEDSLENKDEPLSDTQQLSHDIENHIGTCGDVLGPLLSRQAVVGATDVDYKDKMDKISSQIFEYELLVKQLKDDLRAEKLKAKEEAEDLAQEMAELRYQMTGLLEEERKRRACIEQISLHRITELEAQIQGDHRKTLSTFRHIN